MHAGEHGLGDTAAVATALAASRPRGRVHFFDDCGHVVKVVAPLLDLTHEKRVNGITEEADILRRLSGVPGIPEVEFVEVRDAWQALGTTRIAGSSLLQLDIGPARSLMVVLSLLRVIARISLRGVSHNDIRMENVLLASDTWRVWLVDFDQATAGHTVWRALVRNLIGSHFYPDEAPVHSSLRTLMRSLIRKRTRAAQRRLPQLNASATESQRTLRRAWEIAQASDANAPGDHLAYYTLDFDGTVFPGERPWAKRWDVLSGITDYSGKRLLELGCNMGLLSTWSMKYAGAAEAWGVDEDEMILESAALVASAFGVPARFSRVDLASDAHAVDGLIAFRADIVTCLNVWNWVPNKSHLSRLLATAPELIFEGHESVQSEVDKLRSLGFASVRVASTTERRRPLLHAVRSPS